MFKRLTKIYHEIPSKFWIVVLASFIDGIGGMLLFPFFSLYITQKFGIGMTLAGIILGIMSVFGLGEGGILCVVSAPSFFALHLRLGVSETLCG